MDEFALIRSILAPLVSTPGADGLEDDVAELRASGRIAATADAIVENVHFLPDDPIDTVAAKLVRVNASDLIAKGIAPSECLLSLVWPRARSALEIEPFAASLKAHLDLWNCRLVGGDSTSIDGPLVLSLTMLGVCDARGPVRRSGAQPGDDIWVSGTIGDGWLGLQAARNRLTGINQEDHADLLQAYRVPATPPLELAEIIARHATASIDISDGLASDASHLAEASTLAITIGAASIPLSDPAQRAKTANAEIELANLISGGDDYQALFTAPPEAREAITAAARAAHVQLTRIGACAKGEGVTFTAEDGAPVLPASGWRHQIGS